MSRTLEGTTTCASEALARAQECAAVAGVDVAFLETADQFRRASEVFDTAWGTGPANPQMPPELMRALTHSGSYAASASLSRGTAAGATSMVGAIVAFLGRDDRGLFLHSHLLAVAPDAQTRTVGFALKQHQRAWALDQGLERVMWTFDPLVARNAYFNIHKLGATIATYHTNFYGVMTDAINSADETDRAWAEWELGSPKATQAAAGRPAEPNIDALLSGGAAGGAVVALRADDRDRPQVSVINGRVVLCAVPSDIIAIRGSDAGLAREWRLALREVLGSAIGDGYEVSGFARSGWYVLEARP